MRRIAVAFGIGLLAGAVTYWHLAYIEPETLGFDFTWLWLAARDVLAGVNPYTQVRPTTLPFGNVFLYPLPAAFVAMPFAWMSPAGAAGSFSGISAALLAYGLTAEHWHRLWILASPPFLLNAMSGQWSALMMAAALLPWLSWLAVCKPNVGGAVFAYRPNRIAVIGGMLLLAASFLVLPTWLFDWLHRLRTNPVASYVAPVTFVGGPVLLLAAVRWRTADARWLLLVSLAPHSNHFYTALLPMLVARTKREAQVLMLGACAAYGGYTATLPPGAVPDPTQAGYWSLALIYLPALVIVLRRQNVWS